MEVLIMIMEAALPPCLEPTEGGEGVAMLEEAGVLQGPHLVLQLVHHLPVGTALHSSRLESPSRSLAPGSP